MENNREYAAGEIVTPNPERCEYGPLIRMVGKPMVITLVRHSGKMQLLEFDEPRGGFFSWRFLPHEKITQKDIGSIYG